MPKLLLPGLFMVAGFVAVVSQTFRDNPNELIFLGGLTVGILGAIGVSDRLPTR